MRTTNKRSSTWSNCSIQYSANTCIDDEILEGRVSMEDASSSASSKEALGQRQTSHTFARPYHSIARSTSCDIGDLRVTTIRTKCSILLIDCIWIVTIQHSSLQISLVNVDKHFVTLSSLPEVEFASMASS
nr:hypothetical protein CFP56_78580 [Quercus suber]